MFPYNVYYCLYPLQANDNHEIHMFCSNFAPPPPLDLGTMSNARGSSWGDSPVWPDYVRQELLERKDSIHGTNDVRTYTYICIYT